MTFTLIIIAWLIPGVIAHGLSFAYFQRKYPRIAKNDYWKDLVLGVLMIGLGPCNLVSWLIFINKDLFKYGFKLW